ncbi:MAG: hypothetical protein QXL78_00935 [Methanocellales archaeon]
MGGTRRITIAFMFFLIIFSSCLTQDEMAIKETLKRYEASYNARDIAGFQSVMARNLSQSDVEALFRYFDAMEMKIHISKVNSIAINGTIAIANLTIECAMADVNNTVMQNFELIKTDGDWKISKI